MDIIISRNSGISRRKVVRTVVEENPPFMDANFSTTTTTTTNQSCPLSSSRNRILYPQTNERKVTKHMSLSTTAFNSSYGEMNIAHTHSKNKLLHVCCSSDNETMSIDQKKRNSSCSTTSTSTSATSTSTSTTATTNDIPKQTKPNSSSGIHHNPTSTACCGSIMATTTIDVPFLPMYYPVERHSSLQVRATASTIETIVSRTIRFLRINSIYCSYRDTTHGRFDCLSSGRDRINFTIQLWRRKSETGALNSSSSSSNNNNNNIKNNMGAEEKNDDYLCSHATATILVEVQRLRGSTIEMQRIRNCFFRLIQTDHDEKKQCSDIYNYKQAPKFGSHSLQPQTVRVKPRFQVETSPSCPSDFTSGGYDDEDSFVLSSVGHCLQLLESSRFDENRLGMESLVIMTDATIVQPNLAKTVSRMLLLRSGSLGEHLQDSLFGYIIHSASIMQQQQGEWGDLSQSESKTYDDWESETNRLHPWWELHALALNALANALQELSVASMNTKPKSNNSLLWSNITNVLLKNLKEASHRPEEAALSAKCLRILLVNGWELKFKLNLKQNIIGRDLIAASQYGKDYHLSLETESERLVKCLSKANQ